MPIFFKTSKSGANRERMFSPLGAESLAELPGFDAIKVQDLEVGTAVGAKPSVPRTSIDLNTHTYLHGEEGVLAELKKKV